MDAMGHCLRLQDAIVEHLREHEKLLEDTEAAIAEQDSMSVPRQLLRNVLAEEHKLIKAFEKLLDVSQDTINRLDAIQMLDRGKAG